MSSKLDKTLFPHLKEYRILYPDLEYRFMAQNFKEARRIASYYTKSILKRFDDYELLEVLSNF